MTEATKDRRRFEDFWKILWRRKWIVALTVGATVAAVIVGNMLTTPLYEAFTTLYVKEQTPSVLGRDYSNTTISDITPAEEINTQIAILKSRSVLEGVIAKLGLVDRFTVKDGLGESERLQITIDKLRSALTVSVVANTRLIRVALRSRDPELAMQIANAIAQAFVDRDVESRRGEANAVLSFVSNQVNEVSLKLDAAEEDLLKYKQSQGIAVLDEETRLKLDRLSELESSYQQARLDRQILSIRIAAILKTASTGDALATLPESPSMKALQEQLSALQDELARLAPGDAGGASLKARIEDLKKAVQAELQGAVKPGTLTSVSSVLQAQLADYRSQDVVLATQEDALRSLIDAGEADINSLSAQEIRLARLERARRINDDLYSALMKSRNEAQIEAASQIGNIDVIDPAVTPLVPVSPKTQENLLVGFLLSLLMGTCFAFLFEYFDNAVKTEEEVKKLLEVPLLGFIPKFSQNGSHASLKRPGIPSNSFSLLTRDEPSSSVSEAFRMLRTNLFFIELDRGLKTIAVTSAIPGEGKTTVAANLAIALAAQEEKILIVDADLRAPAVHRIFSLPQSPGFTNFLADRTPYQDLIQEIPGVPNLAVITSGPLPPNPAEVVGSSRMKNLIEELRQGYDRVIFDAPPVLAATEAVVLASLVDGNLLVLSSGKMDRRMIKRAHEVLGNTRALILGGVLNRVDRVGQRYSYQYYRTPERSGRKR